MTQQANPGARLKEPDGRSVRRTTTTLGEILADKTREERTRQRKPSGLEVKGSQEMPPPGVRPRRHH